MNMYKCMTDLQWCIDHVDGWSAVIGLAHRCNGGIAPHLTHTTTTKPLPQPFGTRSRRLLPRLPLGIARAPQTATAPCDMVDEDVDFDFEEELEARQKKEVMATPASSALADARDPTASSSQAAPPSGGTAPQPAARGSREDLEQRVQALHADLQARQKKTNPNPADDMPATRDHPGMASALAEAIESSSSSGTSESETEAREKKKPEHHKFPFGCVNFGALRTHGDRLYAANVYNLPVFLAATTEATPEHLAQFTMPRDTWLPAAEIRGTSALAEAPQGMETPGKVHRWVGSELYYSLAVVGRASRVESYTTKDNYCVSGKKGNSRLLWVDVRWRVPINGEQNVEIVVGHLHSVDAKKDNDVRRRWFAKLAGFCAGGGRIVALDANMAVFGVVSEMAKWGVGLTLVSHHYELRGGEPRWDTLGIWIVGPMNIKATKLMAPAAHVLAGAFHPMMADVAERNINRGYKRGQHQFRPPSLLDGDLSALADVVEGITADFEEYPKNSAELRDVFGIAPWQPVRAHRDFCAGGGLFPKEKIGLDFNPTLTYLRENPWEQAPMEHTDHMPAMPATMEILAAARSWDPFGHRWGRDSHWPLMISVGTARYRSVVMQRKRKEKQTKKREARDAEAGKGEKHAKGKGKGKGKEKGTAKDAFCAGGANPGLVLMTAAQAGAAPPPPPPQATDFRRTGKYTATWSGYNLHWFAGSWTTQHSGSWWTLVGPDPEFYIWQRGQHWWRP